MCVRYRVQSVVDDLVWVAAGSFDWFSLFTSADSVSVPWNNTARPLAEPRLEDDIL